MIKLLSVLILIFSFSVPAFSQKVFVTVTIDNKVADTKSDTIYYNINRPLTWDDFKGVPENNSPGGAITSSGFAFSANMNMVDNNVYLNLKVYTFFSKKNSWKKSNISTAYHLLHEQHHFDITRIGAQKFYNELLKANFTLANYKNLLTSIFNSSFEESRLFQERYDRETRNSIDTTVQMQWNEKISQEIKSIQ
ncbi:MAG: hypothetical protein ABIN97_18445 [Ginsengibacter sp.]